MKAARKYNRISTPAIHVSSTLIRGSPRVPESESESELTHDSERLTVSGIVGRYQSDARFFLQEPTGLLGPLFHLVCLVCSSARLSSARLSSARSASCQTRRDPSMLESSPNNAMNQSNARGSFHAPFSPSWPAADGNAGGVGMSGKRRRLKPPRQSAGRPSIMPLIIVFAKGFAKGGPPSKPQSFISPCPSSIPRPRPRPP